MLQKLSSYLFELPQELIAQYPCVPRDQSRLMLVDRPSGNITEMVFHDLVDFLKDGDRLIFNNTKVIPARLIGNRESGGSSEVLLLRCLEEGLWEALVRPAKKLKLGTRIAFASDFYCDVQEELPDGKRLLKFSYEGSFDLLLNKYGKIPLPPYINREEDRKVDCESYQTIYAAVPGAVAAPTAGLHFTQQLLDRLNKKGIKRTDITLHVGMGTFKPVQTENITEHQMHFEQAIITPQAARELRSENQRNICIGTTTCRVLEHSWNVNQGIEAGEFETNLFIYPGYKFKFVKHLLTNFHLPGSSLFMLTCAFGGYDLIKEAYAKAIKDKFRFFSYGDAMLIL